MLGYFPAIMLTYLRMGLTDDGHEGVEVADVETLPGNVDEELYHLGPLLLLRRLEKKGTRDDFLSTSQKIMSRIVFIYISAPCKRACSNIKTTVGGSNTL